MSTLPRLAAFTLAFAAAGACAQKLSPGLWEMSMQMKSQSGQMESAAAQMREQMAKMPAEQRKMIEDMMAKQGVGLGGSQPSMLRVCISPEQAARGELPDDASGNCKRETLSRSASSLRFRFACTNPPSSGSGEVTFSGDKSYAMKMLADTTIQGKSERMEMQQSARWVAADCGTLKPVR